MTFSCWPHWRLRLYRRGGKGCHGFMLASLLAKVV